MRHSLAQSQRVVVRLEPIVKVRVERDLDARGIRFLEQDAQRALRVSVAILAAARKGRVVRREPGLAQAALKRAHRLSQWHQRCVEQSHAIVPRSSVACAKIASPPARPH